MQCISKIFLKCVLILMIYSLIAWPKQGISLVFNSKKTENTHYDYSLPKTMLWSHYSLVPLQLSFKACQKFLFSLKKSSDSRLLSLVYNTVLVSTRLPPMLPVWLCVFKKISQVLKKLMPPLLVVARSQICKLIPVKQEKGGLLQ